MRDSCRRRGRPARRPSVAFVSAGAIDGSTMTLARRYIAVDDPRAAWASPAAVLAVSA